MGFFSFKMWTCKSKEKRIKNHIFIYNMHGMDAVKYANMYNNHSSSARYSRSSWFSWWARH